MLRRFVSAAVVLVLLGGFAMADTVRGLISSIEEEGDKTILIIHVKDAPDDMVVKKKFTVATDVKVTKSARKGGKEKSSLKELKDVVSKSKGRLKGAFGLLKTKENTAIEISWINIKGREVKKKD